MLNGRFKPAWNWLGTDLFRALLSALAIPVCFFLASCGPREGLKPGAKPPSEDLVDLETGMPRPLSEFSESVVLLNFWASWCAPCVVEMPELEKLHQALKPKGFTVVGIGVSDSVENLKRVRDKAGVTFPILVDREGHTRQSFRIAGFPESFVVGRGGTFTLVVDPETGEPTMRIIGPRPWAESRFQDMFLPLLQPK